MICYITQHENYSQLPFNLLPNFTFIPIYIIITTVYITITILPIQLQFFPLTITIFTLLLQFYYYNFFHLRLVHGPRNVFNRVT